jgi:peptide-methionine (S)-S-oxide reductase
MFFFKPASMPTAEDALPGRPDPIVSPGIHTVLGHPLAGPYPEGSEIAEFALG